MNMYKVDYYTLSRGKDPKGEVGNLKQYCRVAYVWCTDTSKIKSLLEIHYNKPSKGVYYVPVIETIMCLSGHCIVEDE